MVMRAPSDENYREVAYRTMAYLCFENSQVISEESLEKIYREVSRLAFMPEDSHLQLKKTL
jgi:hypothetical protein